MESQKEKQIRKKSPKNGKTQVKVTFVCDKEVYDLLTDELNKSRLINELLRNHYGTLSVQRDY